MNRFPALSFACGTKRIFVALLLTLLIPASLPAATAKKKTLPKPTQEVTVQSEESALIPAPHVKPERKQVAGDTGGGDVVSKPGQIPPKPPVELHLTRGASKKFDVRHLPQIPPQKFERPEREEPVINPITIDRTTPPAAELPTPPVRTTPAPSTIMNFDGLDFANWGAGHPPDTNGDVGRDYYIETINTSIGIYRKSDGVRVAAFTFNTFMSQGSFGNLCDTNNFGDPVVLYDTFEDRWIITDFAFQLSGGNVVNPPGSFQCIAASMSGDPVTGGWSFYSINTAGGLGDYPKFGIWPDGLYMTTNMFGYPSGAPFQGARAYAFNKAQMYAGNPTVQVASFDIPGGDFTVLPSNARLQSGTPPAGSPNYYLSTSRFLNAVSVYKFHVNWNNIASSTFTGPDTPIAATSWPNSTAPAALSLGGNSLDVLATRAMMQNQYTNIGGAESLWVAHTVRRANTSGLAAPRWYQVDVTGGTVNPNIPQATTWDPDGANVLSRFIPSVAVDRAGNMAMGYSTSSSTTKPAIAYAGRLAADPVNTFSQTEQTIIQGAGTQVGNCGSGPCTRWGDYSAMTLDPNGCTFWFTSMYYAVDGLNHQTRIASFAYPSCTTVGNGGSITGTVTFTVGGGPVSGATVALGSRLTSTDSSGNFSFSSIPAGTYATLTASYPGYAVATATNIVVTDGGTTNQNLSLSGAPANGCATDTTQPDFLNGVGSNVDLTTSPGAVQLNRPPTLDQQNTTLGTSGAGINATNWSGQTFTAGVNGPLSRVDLNLFCSGCSGSTPLTLSIRDTSGGLPTGPDLVSATIPAFTSGASAYYTVIFPVSLPVTLGTKYAIIIRPNANNTAGIYAITRSGTSAAGTDVYAGGDRITSGDSGATWALSLSGTTTPGVNDAGFKTYIDTGFVASGTLTSSTKDANPAVGASPVWTSLSWTAAVPASTSVAFQVAGSNSINGPFNFVGPDGTAATFFTTSGASLHQFDGNRYLQYEAYLATSDSNSTPVLNDVTVCFDSAACSNPPTITAPAAVCASSTGNTASGPAGWTSYQWSITNGVITAGTNSQTVTFTAGSSGSVGLTLIATDPAGCVSTNSSTLPTSSGSPDVPTISATTNGTGTQDQACPEQPLTLNASSTGALSYQWYENNDLINGATSSSYQATGAATYYVTATNGCGTSAQSAGYVVQNPTPHSPFISFRNQDSSVTTLAICQGTSQIIDSDSATGIQWWKDGSPISGANSQSYTATQAGVYTAQLNALGCHSQFGRTVTITVDAMPSTPTVSGATNGTGTQDQACPEQPLTLTASSTGAVSYQWYNDNAPLPGENSATLIVTAVGNYSVTATNGTCTTARSATYVVQNPTPHSPFISFRNQNSTVTSLAICEGSSQIIDSDSATGIQWWKDGSPIPGANSQSYTATQAGVYTAQLNALGCHSQFGRNVTLTVNPTPATPTITPGGPTTFCAGGSVTLTSSSASGNQWYLNGSPIGAATNNTYNAALSGNYTVVVTASGCPSAPSAATSVTVNAIPATPTATNGGPYVEGQTIQLNAPTVGGALYSWTGPGGFTSSLQNPAIASSTFANAGTYSVTVSVSGCSSAAGTTDVVVDRAPVLNAIGNKSVAERTTLNFTVTATDADGDTPTYTITNAPAGSTFNTTTGAFTWTPTTPQMGTYLNVIFGANDGRGGTASSSINMVVRARTKSDYDADGRADIFWRNTSTGQNYVYRMNNLTILSQDFVNNVSTDWQLVATGDFDGDGHADVLWRNSVTGQNYVYLMNGSTIGPNGVINEIPDQNWKAVGTGDFDGDGKADILWRNISTGVNYIYFMNGLTITNQVVVNTVPVAWQVAAVADFNGDHKADILWRNTSTGEANIYVMNGATIVQSGVFTTIADQNWVVAGTGDFNLDGKADIIWHHLVSGMTYIYFMNGRSILQQDYVNTVADPAWHIVATGDFSGDGITDILWRNFATGQNYVYLMNGSAIGPNGPINTIPDQNWTVIGK